MRALGINGYAVGVEVDGVRYPSARYAAVSLGMNIATLSKRAHSADWPNYRWLGATPGPRLLHTPDNCQMGRSLVEPPRWAYDGDLTRRASVMDPNAQPPKLVRRIGWVRCMRCRRPHFSEDVARIRMCANCGGAGGLPIGTAATDDL